MTLDTMDREGLAEDDLPLAELAAAMRLPQDWELIPGQIERLGRLLRAAIHNVEAHSSYALIEREFLATGEASGGPDVSIPLRPVTALLEITVGPRTVRVEDVRMEHRRERTHLLLPFAAMAGVPVRVALTAGRSEWADVPAPLREAVMATAQSFDELQGSTARHVASALMAPFRSVRLRGVH